MGRIVFIPIVCFLLWIGDPWSCYAAAWCFGAASATDYFDGYLARRRGLVSKLGKFLDPLADKLIVMASLTMLIPLGRIPAWFVIVILTRELAVTGLRAIAAGDNMIIDAGSHGKWKTAFQLTAIVGLLVHFEYKVDFLFFEGRVSFHRVGFWLLCISLFFSITSAFTYFKAYMQLVRRGGGSETAETS